MSRIDMSTMNEPQRQAVTHGEGPLLLLAGPGSGKTFTITNRILYLLEQGVRPESVLVITFMKEAALSMQNRFRKIAAGASVNAPSYPVNFGTFHSVFYHILRESNALASNSLLSNSDKKNLILPILKAYESREESRENDFENQNCSGDDALKLLTAISYYKNTMQAEAAAAKAPLKWQPRFEDIRREYERAVRKTGRLEFDDMLCSCKTLLEENVPVRRYWQGRFRHILIDEFQDINPVQYEVVKLLTSKPCNLFAVGDDDQAIYGFRGSQPECLKRFEEEFHARRLLLDINYRSCPEIVNASLKVIEENKNRFAKKLRAARESAPVGVSKETVSKDMPRQESPVRLRKFAEREEQYEYMRRTLAATLSGEETHAVLFRTNSYMQSFAAGLKSADIPYEMKEPAASIYEHFIVKDIMAYLLTARGEGTREHMLRIINRPSRHISRDALSRGTDFGKIREYYTKIQMPEPRKSKVENELLRLEKQLNCVKGFLLRPAISYILKAVGYEGYLRSLAGASSEKWQEWQELLEWLKQDAASYRTPTEWQKAQTEYARAMEQNKALGGGKGRIPGKPSEGVRKDGMHPVQLLTVHGAKGLEFDRVWIPDCNEKVFPHGTMPDENTLEEERRIFYVAMTRAKKSLELLCLTGTKERPGQPSVFLNPLL